MQATKNAEQNNLELLTLGRTHLFLVLLLLITAISAAYQVRVPSEVRLGEQGDRLYIRGFYPPESNPYDVYRWSGEKGIVRFPGVGSPQALALRIRMNGVRPEGVPLPRILLSVNGREIAHLTAAGQMEIYEFQIPREKVGWSGDVEVEIQSETFSPIGQDRRELGVIVDWVMILPHAEGIVIPSPLPLASVAIPLLAAFLALGERKLAWKATLPVAVGVSVLAYLLFASRRVEAVRWSWELALLFSVGYLGFIAFKDLPALRGILRSIRRPTIAILLLASVVHLALLLPRFDRAPNTWTYKDWMWQATGQGLQSFYLRPSLEGLPEYPPVSLYVLTLIGRLYETAAQSSIPPPLEEPTPVLSFVIRLPGAVANVLLSLMIYLWVERRRGSRQGHLAMAAFALNPAVVLHATRWGQTDSIHSLFVLLAIVCVTSKRPSLSWFLLGLAVAIKPQALLFVPLVLVLTWQRSHWRGILKGVLATASTALVVLAPFIYLGTWMKVVEYFSGLARYHPWTTSNALNLWWVLGLGNRFADTSAPWWIPPPISGPLSYRTIGFSFLAIALLLVLCKVSDARDKADMWAISAYAAFILFMVPTKVHENYVYTVFPLLAMTFFASRSTVVIYAVLSCTWLVNNLMLHETAIIDLLDPHRIGIEPYTLWDLGMMLAALVNTASLGYWTAMLCRKKDPQP